MRTVVMRVGPVAVLHVRDQRVDSGTGVISVAASDPTSGFPGATVALSTGASSTAINANGGSFTDGTALPVKVLRNPNGSISLGAISTSTQTRA